MNFDPEQPRPDDSAYPPREDASAGAPPPSSPEPPPLAGVAGDGAPLDPRDETTLWTGRTHWQHFVGWLGGGAVALLLLWTGLVIFNDRLGLSGGSTFLWAVLAAVVVGGVVGVVILVHVLQHRYRLTNQRLFIEKGILSQTIDQTELIRVDDVRVRKSLIDRLLGMGTIEVLSTDASDRSVTITGVKNAEQVAEHIRIRMRTLRSRSLFVENL